MTVSAKGACIHGNCSGVWLKVCRITSFMEMVHCGSGVRAVKEILIDCVPYRQSEADLKNVNRKSQLHVSMLQSLIEGALKCSVLTFT